MRHFMVIVVLGFCCSGCYDGHTVSDSSELVIEHGEVEGTSVNPDTVGALLTSVFLVSHSNFTIEIRGVQLNLCGEVSEDLASSITNLRLVRGGDRAVLTAVQQPADRALEYITFDETITLEPGEGLLLMLVADIPPAAFNRIELELGVSSFPNRRLFSEIVYADNGERVPEELVQGNISHVRRIMVGP
ncbi:MAG: hypothetical protein WCK01_01035 [Candidatus Uhrbacteria bacterium]